MYQKKKEKEKEKLLFSILITQRNQGPFIQE